MALNHTETVLVETHDNHDILNAVLANEFTVDPFSFSMPVSHVSMETTKSLGVIQHNLFSVWILKKRKIADKAGISSA